MSKSPKPPPAPDYKGAAVATAAGNLEMAKQATQDNRINQVNPWGAVNYSQDPAGKWTQTETLDPKLQAALDSQLSVQQGLSDQAGSMLGAVKNAYNTPYVAPDRAAYTADVNKVNQDSVGRAGTFASTAKQNMDFQSTAPGLNTTYDRFSQTTPGQITDVSQFAGTGAGQDTRNLSTQSYTAGAQPVDQRVNLSGVNDTNQTSAAYQRSVAPVNQNIASALGGVNATNQNARSQLTNVQMLNQNAPQFDPAQADLYARKAYDAQMALMRPGLDEDQQRLQNSLALQGLGVTSEANQQAQFGQSRARAAQENALAASSYASGADNARGNYASQLAGFNASNQARDQAFNQGMNIFGANNQAQNQAFNQGTTMFDKNNAAQAQAYGQAANNFGMDNQAQNQAFNQRMGTFGANNQAQNQAFSQGLQSQAGDINAMQASNQARNTEFGQGLASFGAQQAAIGQANAARGTAYNQSANTFGLNQDSLSAENAARQNMFAQQLQEYQAQNQAAANQFGQDQSTFGTNLQGLQANAGLQAAENRAQEQAYAQGISNYGLDSQAGLQARNQPLNEMNALLTGQQVRDPQFEQFYQQNPTKGADYLSATTAQGQYDQGVYNQKAAGAAGTNGAITSIATTAAMVF